MSFGSRLSRLWIPSVLVAVLLSVAMPAQAKRGKNKPAQPAEVDEDPLTFLVVLPDKEAPKDIAPAIEDFFKQAARFYPDYEITQGTKRKVKKRARKCKEDTTCLAKLGKRPRATEVLLARVSPGATEGSRVRFEAISVASGEVTRNLDLELASVDEVPRVLAEQYFTIMGVTTPGYVEIENAPPTVIVDGREMSIASGPLRLAPGPHTIRVGEEEQRAMVLPGEVRQLTFESLAPPPEPEPTAVAAAPAPGEGAGTTDPAEGATESTEDSADSEPEEITAVADGSAAGNTPEPEPELTSEEPGTESSLSLFPGGTVAYAGYGAAGLGLVGFVVGSIFGSKTTADVGDDTPQAEAKRKNKSAKQNASTANLLFGVGGALVAIGVGLWAVDVFVLGPEPTVAVDAGASSDGGAVNVTVRW